MSDCCSAPGLMPFAEAYQRLMSSIAVKQESQLVAIEDAVGRVLKSDLFSPVNVPPHNNSAMDGYAIKHTDNADKVSYENVGSSFAGAPFYGNCENGQCIRIMTGAKMPSCCDTVIMQEQATVDGNMVRFNKAIRPAQNVRMAGEDIAKGDVVLAKGHKIKAVDIGLLASLGVETVEVVKAVTVAVLSTGDELKLPGQVLSDGDIYESNRFALIAMLEKMHVNIIDFGIITDDKQKIRQAFVDANEQADIVISSGGVSVGEADYTKEVLEQLGEIDFWKIAMKPGKPFAFGKLSKSIFFGLPGNPVSALVTFYKLASKGIEKMQGIEDKPALWLCAELTNNIKKSPGRIDFQRAIYSYNENGQPVVSTTGSQGSGILTSIGKANCFIVLAAEDGPQQTGNKVRVEPFNYLFS